MALRYGCVFWVWINSIFYCFISGIDYTKFMQNLEAETIFLCLSWSYISDFSKVFSNRYHTLSFLLLEKFYEETFIVLSTIPIH